MKQYRIVYHLLPDAEDIELTVFAKTEEEAIIYAKEYRPESFSIFADTEEKTAITPGTPGMK